MQRRLSFFSKLRSSLPVISIILAVSAVLMALVLVLYYWKGAPIQILTRDPISFSNAPSYVGFLSQIGILLWSATAAICFLCATVLFKMGYVDKRGFLFASGLLTAVLCLDDTFMLHEKHIPHFLGTSEMVVYIGYLGIIVLFLSIFFSDILETEYILLGMALSFFAISVIVDNFGSAKKSLMLIEDGAKLVGILSWLAYFFRTSTSVLIRSVAQRDPAPDDNSA